MKDEPDFAGMSKSGRQYPSWNRLVNRSTQFALDVAVLGLAFVLAYLLRVDFVLSD